MENVQDSKSLNRSQNEYISFSAILKGKLVRITANLNVLEIVTRDNVESFEPEEYAKELKKIEFEDIY